MRSVYSSRHRESRPAWENAALTLYLVVLASVLTSIAQRGSKVTLSLYALDLGAGSFAVGLLGALYASFPLILAVHAGRISDRFGVRYPMLFGGTVMALALAIPAVYPSLPILFAAGALMGLGHIFFHVSVHNLVGSLGAADRTKNFATFSLGSAIAAFVGPSLAGFSIEYAGFRPALLLLAASAALPAVAMLVYSPPPAHGEPEERTGNAFDLLAIPDLRRTLIMSGVALTGIELFSFYLPIYGRSIGLAPSVIGMVLSCYAVAGFMVRSFMHHLARRYTEIGVLTGSLFLAAAAYALLPALHEAVPLGMAAFALGLALGSAQPLTIILTYNHAPKGRSGEALGMRIMANKVTQIAVPLAFGGLGAAMGSVPVFLATGAFLFVAGLLSLKSRSTD
jgi:predicted MFS family arabinose efflux permease